jgi:predicted P-loop ATPase
MEPGCIADDILILCGDQGFLKSTLFETLASTDWFLDSCEGTGNDKDTLMQMHYSWIIELAEIDRFLNKRSASDLKKSLSVREDKFRLPYGAGIETFKRKFVTCGTTNQDEFLTDATGNRRYWVVEVKTKIDIDWVKEHRSQIWAAAVHLYHQGHTWYLNDEERARHAELMKPFEISDTWEDYIEPYLAVRNKVTVADILHNCLFIEPALQKRSQQMRVAEILKRMGWIKKDRGVKVWVNPGSDKGSGQVAVKVAGDETLASNESQSSPATSTTMNEKNIFTLEDNNENSKKETEITNRATGSEVANDKNNDPKTQSQKASPSNATSAPTSAATSKKIKVGDKETLIQQDLQEMSPTSPTFSQKNNLTPENNNHMQNPKTEI